MTTPDQSRATRFEAIKARLSRLNNHPWYVQDFGELTEHGETFANHCQIVMGADEETIIADHMTTQNADFVAHAAGDLAFLFAEIDRLKTEVQAAFERAAQVAEENGTEALRVQAGVDPLVSVNSALEIQRGNIAAAIRSLAP